MLSFRLEENEQTAHVVIDNATELWHKRLGHCNQVVLQDLKKRNMVQGLPLLEDLKSVCKACQFGKQTRLPFTQTIWRATQKLQLVHTDLSGPKSESSLKGSRYYIAFIDDLTRMCWIYFLRFKTEVAGVFWRFKAWIENQSGCRIQVIRSDNGTEYTSEQFTKFCEEARIEHQFSTPYTPQQNGVSERKNRTIMEMSRCMLHEKDLPKKFWAEAANTAVFLQNRLPTKSVQGKTPFEAWYGYKPLVKNLKVFGCICYTLVPQVKRDKLDKRADPGIFIGYSNFSKAYRVFQPESGKIVISRDVHFAEEEKWHWEDKKGTSVAVSPSFATPPLVEDETVDDLPIRGTRLLSDVYQRCNLSMVEPGYYNEAATDPNWIEAMQEELKMIEKNQTWDLVNRPQHKKVIGVKWVYKTKLNADGSINKHKARLVVKGYAQVYGVDFSDTFAPVARLDTIRLILEIAAQKRWTVFQLDVKSAFLNGYLEEEIFVEQPEGFVVQGQEDKVYLLKKALYGLKQAPRAWYSRIDEHLQNLGFMRSLSESTLYIKHSHADILIVSLYVDDLLVTGSNVKQVDQFKQEMLKVF